MTSERNNEVTGGKVHPTDQQMIDGCAAVKGLMDEIEILRHCPF